MRRLDWRASIQIPLAGIAAIRLIAAAGAGGVAVTAWALGRAGMEARVIACRMVANLIVQYAVYLAARLRLRPRPRRSACCPGTGRSS